MSDIPDITHIAVRDSYLVRLARGTASLASGAVNLGYECIDYLTAPNTRIIKTRMDHDERHRGLHYTYHRGIKTS